MKKTRKRALPPCKANEVCSTLFAPNTLFLDEAKAGVSRESLVKALQAEGVRASVWEYPENHKFAIYSEPQWWHHPVDVPKVLPGTDTVNARA